MHLNTGLQFCSQKLPLIYDLLLVLEENPEILFGVYSLPSSCLPSFLRFFLHCLIQFLRHLVLIQHLSFHPSFLLTIPLKPLLILSDPCFLSPFPILPSKYFTQFQDTPFFFISFSLYKVCSTHHVTQTVCTHILFFSLLHCLRTLRVSYSKYPGTTLKISLVCNAPIATTK